MITIFKDRHSGMDSRQAILPVALGLMQICSRQICAGIQAPWMDLSLPVHGTKYPLPGGYDEIALELTRPTNDDYS